MKLAHATKLSSSVSLSRRIALSSASGVDVPRTSSRLRCDRLLLLLCFCSGSYYVRTVEKKATRCPRALPQQHSNLGFHKETCNRREAAASGLPPQACGWASRGTSDGLALGRWGRSTLRMRGYAPPWQPPQFTRHDRLLRFPLPDSRRIVVEGTYHYNKSPRGYVSAQQ